MAWLTPRPAEGSAVGLLTLTLNAGPCVPHHAEPARGRPGLALPSRLWGLGKTTQVIAECHRVLGARKGYPGPTGIQSSQGGLPGGGVPCLAETGRDVLFVSVKSPSQTQSCKEREAVGGRMEGASPGLGSPSVPGPVTVTRT